MRTLALLCFSLLIISDILFAITQIVYKYNAFGPGNFEDRCLGYWIAV